MCQPCSSMALQVGSGLLLWPWQSCLIFLDLSYPGCEMPSLAQICLILSLCLIIVQKVLYQRDRDLTEAGGSEECSFSSNLCLKKNHCLLTWPCGLLWSAWVSFIMQEPALVGKSAVSWLCSMCWQDGMGWWELAWYRAVEQSFFPTFLAVFGTVKYLLY